MKKIVFSMVVLITWTLLSAGSATASFIINTLVNPGSLTPHSDDDSLIGIATYYINWEGDTGTYIYGAQVEFASDIFYMSVGSINDPYWGFSEDLYVVSMPAGWSAVIIPQAEPDGGWVAKLVMTFGTPIAGTTVERDGTTVDVGTVSLEIGYRILSESRYYYGNSYFAGETPSEDLTWGWDESNEPGAVQVDIPWVQTCGLFGYGETGPQGPADDLVTNTSTPIPDPSMLLLLGSGLIGIAGYNKLRLRRRKK